MDSSMKNIKKAWMSSLSFLDNCYINSAILIILFLYCTTIFDNINSAVGNSYNYSFVKIIVLLIIVYVAPKDTTVAIFLALTYVISIIYMNSSAEPFRSSSHSSSNQVSNNKRTAEHFMDDDEDFRGGHGVPGQGGHGVHPNKPHNKGNFKGGSGGHGGHPSKSHNKDKKEHFFPFPDKSDLDANSFNSNKVSNNEQHSNMSNSLSAADCMLNYEPKHESVGNVCAPVATFTNELNAQGLNYPEGFDFPGATGSPLMQN